MSHVFHRQSKRQPPVAVAGEGAYLIDSSGKRYLDGSGGAAVSCLGHSHPAVIAAVTAQLERLPYAHSGFFSNEPAEALADHLIARAPAGIDRVFFVSSGSEAVEASLKLARQYFVEIEQPERRHVIARRQSYHGNTLGALAVGGNAWRRQAFEPLLIETHHIAPCYAYRERRPDESEVQYGIRAADELERQILELGERTVMAFICEPVVGATVGAVPAVTGYLRRIREICDRYGVLLILDEVMCGMGRTGSLFACEQDGVAPDIMTIAKCLGAGYQPIGAMLASKNIHDTIAAGSGFFQHGHTYLAHAAACAAGLAVQQTIEQEDLLANVERQGAAIMQGLHGRFGQHPHVGDIRGRGLFIGLELVADRESKAAFDPELQIHARLKQAAMSEGLLCYTMGGTIDGRRGDHALLAPPYNIGPQQVEEIVERMDSAMTVALKGVAA